MTMVVSPTRSPDGRRRDDKSDYAELGSRTHQIWRSDYPLCTPRLTSRQARVSAFRGPRGGRHALARFWPACGRYAETPVRRCANCLSGA